MILESFPKADILQEVEVLQKKISKMKNEIKGF